MIVVKMQTKQRQFHVQSTLFKLLIVPLLSKNKNRKKLVFKSKQYLSKADNFLSQNHIIVTQKHSKNIKSTHKLHSLHRSYNKL